MSQIFNTLAQSSSSGSGGLIAGGAMFVVFILIALASFAVWIWMLVDLLQSSRPTNEKILWALVMFFLGIIGSIVYMVVARGKTTGGTV
jgi:hypothetical protein